MKNLLLAITCLITTTFASNKEGDVSSIVMIKEKKWAGTTLEQVKIKTAVAEIPAYIWMPRRVETESVIVGLHYSGGSKEIWFDSEHEGLLKYAFETGTPFIACDAYAHGEWQIEGVKGWDLTDEQWPVFVQQSGDGISEAVKIFAKEKELSLDSLHFTGVSLGCFNGMDLIANRGLTPVTFAAASLCPYKKYDDEYSAHNNLKAYEGYDLLILSGKKDEYNESGEVQWFYDQIESDRKELVWYDSPHQLPEDEWMDRVVAFIKEKRN